MTEAPISGDDRTSGASVSSRRAEAAFIGAAVGDALGWPNEMKTRLANPKRLPGDLRFQSWIKRSGGRFQPHDEKIAAGDYSDDTQLILAVSRAIRVGGKDWWLKLAREELPLWTVYQRGGGGATRRAATAWLNGHSPWHAQKSDEAKRYFEAGGNGVAMRLLPHCLKRAAENSFTPLGIDVMTDGVCTHGHPRALIGGLAYSFGLWCAFRQKGLLEYGQLIDNVVAGFGEWSKQPDISFCWNDWKSSAASAGDYHRLWADVVDEQLRLLKRAANGLASGAAVIDDEVLDELGCYDPKVNGAGTVSTAGALYLASRHAADPIEALRQAALGQGADTDTLASMTSALLGAALGGDWLIPLSNGLQDLPAIKLAASDLRGATLDMQSETQPVTKSRVERLYKELREINERSAVELPNGAKVEAEPWEGWSSGSRSLSVRGWRIRWGEEREQTLFVKQVTKVSGSALRARSEVGKTHALPECSEAIHVGFRLIVADLRRSMNFYSSAVGLRVSKESLHSVTFGSALSVALGEPPQNIASFLTIFIEVADLDACIQRFSMLWPEAPISVTKKANVRRARCTDPDGYSIEIYQNLGQPG